MNKIRFRAVLDTNVVLPSQQTTSEDSPNKEIINRWQLGQFDVLWTGDVLSEYINKLKEKNVNEELIIQFISQFIAYGEEVKVQFYHYEVYPEDAKDICFVLCALNGNGTHVITYDSHLLDLKADYLSKLGIKIATPIEFLQELRINLAKDK
ncbi:MAG: PIN domain-containing protein [candidate division KSB1 bacterium]|nr:PIN domain-containing protein [candidate division KSB1 bacterium]